MSDDTTADTPTPAPDPDDDRRGKERRVLLRKALAEMAPVEGEARDILEKIGKFVKDAEGRADDEAGLQGLADMIELILPGTVASLERLKTAGLMIASREGLGAVISDDPVLVPAVRILQALLVAVEKGDAEQLREWERKTLAYMMEKAPEDYVRLPIPPRANHDRHIILGVVLRRIKELLNEAPAVGGMMESMMFAMMISALVNAAFPNLREVEGMSVATTVAERYPKHVDKAGTPKDIDPEAILTDALEALGIPRKVVQQSWLKGVKY